MDIDTGLITRQEIEWLAQLGQWHAMMEDLARYNSDHDARAREMRQSWHNELCRHGVYWIAEEGHCDDLITPLPGVRPTPEDWQKRIKWLCRGFVDWSTF